LVRTYFFGGVAAAEAGLFGSNSRLINLPEQSRFRKHEYPFFFGGRLAAFFIVVALLTSAPTQQGWNDTLRRNPVLQGGCLKDIRGDRQSAFL
jgi:hypothetical protein